MRSHGRSGSSRRREAPWGANVSLDARQCVTEMRISVSVIVGQIAHDASFEEILAGYPDLESQDFQQAVQYAAWLTQEQVQHA